MAARSARLLHEAADVLSANDTGRFIKPGPHQYPGQWNWDVAFIVMGLAHLDPHRAREEVRSLLSGQWTDGMVPHIVFHDGDVDYYPGPHAWGRTPSMPGVSTSGITQPPLLATAVARLHRLAPDEEFLEEVADPIDRWHRWFHTRRRDGLIGILHPWESGMDNSPRFDAALGRVDPLAAPTPRRDMRHVPPRQRPTDADYRRYLAIVASLRSEGYRPDLEAASFNVPDVTLSAILARAERDLAEILEVVGRDGEAARRRARRLERAIAAAWDEPSRQFVGGGDPVPRTIGGLLPSMAVLGHRAVVHLERLLHDPGTFGASPGSPWHPTSVAKDEPIFDPERYWRGPVWANVNWLVVDTLRAAGRASTAEAIRAATLEMVAEHGFHEYYNPRTGEGLGSGSFSWTAALTIDLLAGE